MRRLRWNALESADCAVCAELRRLRRMAPIALFALFAPNCADCAGIALEFCLYSLAHSQYYPVAVTSVLQPAVSGQCLSCQVILWLTESQRDKQCRSKTTCFVIASHSASVFGERPRISPQLTCSRVHTRNSACTSELFWVCYTYISVICA